MHVQCWVGEWSFEGLRGRGRGDLEQDLDEDPGARCCVIFCDPYGIQHSPGNGVSCQQVRKELGDIAQLVGLQAVHKGILLPEAFLVQGLPALVVAAVALCQETIVPALKLIQFHGRNKKTLL